MCSYCEGSVAHSLGRSQSAVTVHPDSCVDHLPLASWARGRLFKKQEIERSGVELPLSGLIYPQRKALRVTRSNNLHDLHNVLTSCANPSSGDSPYYASACSHGRSHCFKSTTAHQPLNVYGSLPIANLRQNEAADMSVPEATPRHDPQLEA